MLLGCSKLRNCTGSVHLYRQNGRPMGWSFTASCSRILAAAGTPPLDSAISRPRCSPAPTVALESSSKCTSRFPRGSSCRHGNRTTTYRPSRRGASGVLFDEYSSQCDMFEGACPRQQTQNGYHCRKLCAQAFQVTTRSPSQLITHKYRTAAVNSRLPRCGKKPRKGRAQLPSRPNTYRSLRHYQVGFLFSCPLGDGFRYKERGVRVGAKSAKSATNAA